MKVFPSYAANPKKRQFSFRSPKSAILPSATCTCDDHFHIEMLPKSASAACTYDDNFHFGKPSLFVSRCSSEKSEMGLVHEEWMGKDG